MVRLRLSNSGLRSGWVPAAVAAFLGFTVWLAWPAMHGHWLLDDLPRVQDNRGIESGSIFWRSLFDRSRATGVDPSRPLVFASYTLNVVWGGRDPFGFHLVNLALHLLNGTLVWLLTRQLWRTAFPSSTLTLWPWATAALFVLSPLNVGTAAYISGRSDLLGTLGMLGATVAFAGCVRRGSLVAALLFYLVALGSKQSTVVLPVLLLGVRWMQRRAPSPVRPWSHHLPFWGLTALYLGVRYGMFGALGDMEAETPWPRGRYLAVQPWAIFEYLRMSLWPQGLSLDHDVGLTFLPKQLLVPLVGFAVLGGLLWRVRSSKDGWTLGVCATGWYFLCLLPVSSVFPTVDALVERRAYVSSVAVYWLLPPALEALARGRSELLARRWLAPTLVALGLVFAVLARGRFVLYGDHMAIWSETRRLYPHNVRALSHLYRWHLLRGEYAPALDALEQAHSLLRRADTALELAELLRRPDFAGQDLPRARALLQEALGKEPTNVRALFALANLEHRAGQLDEARRGYEAVLALEPKLPRVWGALGSVCWESGRWAEAEHAFSLALRYAPEDAQARAGLDAVRRGAKP